MHDRPARPTAFCWNQNCPRICGEKFTTVSALVNWWGSPPHMRGKELLTERYAIEDGITPAYAGKSRIGCSGSTGSKDHPRICGEKSKFGTWLKCASGSPPRMRGKELHVGILLCGIGITPAYAGKSGSVSV